MAIISQSYRTHEGPEIDLVALFGQLVDESRRRQANNQSDEMAMATQAKPTQAKPTQAKPIKAKCPYCKKKGHTPERCWVKHPHLMPKDNIVPKKPGEKLDKPTEAYIADGEEIILYSTILESIGT